jgi:hypothetical protein
MKYNFLILVLSLGCLCLPWRERKSSKKARDALLVQTPEFYMAFSLCLFFTVSGCKFSLTSEHLEYIREFIISFLLNNPYHFYSILLFLKNGRHHCITKPFKLSGLLYDVVILLGVLVAHFKWVRRINLRSFVNFHFILSIIKMILKHFYSLKKAKSEQSKCFTFFIVEYVNYSKLY